MNGVRRTAEAIERLPFREALKWEARKRVLTEFDQNTIANMTAALEYVCKKIPENKDGYETRKRIADAMVACGNDGKRSLIDFQNAGMKVLDEIIGRAGFNWFGLRRSKRK
jgi:hypothetical protein